MRIVLIVMSVLALVAAGCSARTQTPPSVAPAGVNGPWQADPLPVDAAMAAATERICAASGTVIGTAAVVLHDQRGLGIDSAMYVGPAGTWLCVAAPATGLMLAALGSAPDGVGPGAREIIVDGGGSSGGTVTQTQILGRAGPGVARVRIALSDGGSVTASLRGGHFVAWWPSDAQAISEVGEDAAGNDLGTFPPRP